MKKSLAHLPEDKRYQLKAIVNRILEDLPNTQMIILYGSYARGDYVEYDQRVDFGIPTYYVSDFDLLVVTQGIKYSKAGEILSKVEHWHDKHNPTSAPLQTINDDILALNKYISDRRYFYTDIKKEGILLYDSRQFKLARRRKLNFEEIKQQAQEYYDEKYQSAFEFYDNAEYNYKKEYLKKSAFMLHQAAENSFQAVELAYTLYRGKVHNLEKLLDKVKKYDLDGYGRVFPRETEEEQRLFKLLQAAYIEARYNPQFVVTKEDIDALMPVIEQLLELTKQVCEKRIEDYGRMK